MTFSNNKIKINIEPKLFYITISFLALFVIINTIFFGISMNPKEILNLVEDDKTFNKIQTTLIINYVVQMGICIIFAITLSLALYQVKIGYLFTAIWVIAFTAIVFIPIILNKNISDYRSIINIVLFIFIQISISLIHKEIFLNRKLNKRYKTKKGGLEW